MCSGALIFFVFCACWQGKCCFGGVFCNTLHILFLVLFYTFLPKKSGIFISFVRFFYSYFSCVFIFGCFCSLCVFILPPNSCERYILSTPLLCVVLLLYFTFAQAYIVCSFCSDISFSYVFARQGESHIWYYALNTGCFTQITSITALQTVKCF